MNKLILLEYNPYINIFKVKINIKEVIQITQFYILIVIVG